MNIDHLIVFSYLIGMLVLGIWAGRGVKSIKDFAVAHGTFPPVVMSIAFIATIVGGTATVGFVEAIHKDGIIFIIADSANFISYLFMAYFVAKRFHRFKGLLSIGEIMGVLYGPKSRIVTGLLGAMVCMVIVSSQCKAMGYLLNATFGYDEIIGIIFGAAVFTIYSTFGGVRSVTITDIIQFGILIVIIPVVANIVVTGSGGMETLIANVPQHKFEIFSHDRFWEFFVILIVWGIFPTFAVNPAFIQRMLMVKDYQATQTMFKMGALMVMPFNFMVALIGFAAVYMFPEINSGVAFPSVINYSLPAVLKGLAIAGLLAVIMSSADSFLNSGAILIVHDVVTPLSKGKKLPELRITKLVTLLMGALGVYFAAGASSIISLTLYAISLWGPIIVIPLMYGIFGCSSSQRAFLYTACSTGFGFILFSKFLLPEGQEYWASLIAIAINIVSFAYFTHRYRDENIVVADRFKCQFPLQWDIGFSRIKEIINWARIGSFINSRVEKVGASVEVFAIFCCLSYIIPYFMWPKATPAFYQEMLMLRIISGMLCVGLLLKPLWPSKFSRYFNYYWYLTLIVCLPFSTTIMAITQKFDTEWIVNISLAIFLLALLVDWISFVMLLAIGTYAGYISSMILIGEDTVNLGSDQAFLIIYILIFSTLIGLLFSRKREVVIDGRINNVKEQTGITVHDLKSPFASMKSVLDVQSAIFDSASTKVSGDLVKFEVSKADYEMLTKSRNMMNKSVGRGLNYIQALTHSPLNDRQVVSIKECIDDALDMFGANALHTGKLALKHIDDFKFIGSKQKVSHVILNLLNNSVKHCSQDIDITVTALNNKLIIQDNGIGISKDIITKVFDDGFSTDNTSSGKGLGYCESVMRELGGRIECESLDTGGAKFTLVFV